MKKWIEMLSLAALSLGLLVAPSNVEANYYGNYGNGNGCDPCQPCDPCVPDPCCYNPCCFGGFSIGVDFIYWDTCIDDLDYAAHELVAGGTPTVHHLNYKRVKPSWEPGFRVRLGKPDIFCRWTLLASYTWLNVKEHDSAHAETNGAILSTLLHSDLDETTEGRWQEVDAHYKLNYQSWDILAAYPCEFCQCHVWIPFVGIEGIHLDQKYRTFLYNASNVNGGYHGHTKWHTDFNAVGLKIGQDYEFRFCENFKFFSRASATIAVGEPDGHYHQGVSSFADTELNEFRITDHYNCHVVPGYHIQLGVAYESCLCGIDFAARLGYEFVQWYNIPTERRFPATDERGAISTSSDSRAIGFHGILAGLDFKF